MRITRLLILAHLTGLIGAMAQPAPCKPTSAGLRSTTAAATRVMPVTPLPAPATGFVQTVRLPILALPPNPNIAMPVPTLLLNAQLAAVLPQIPSVKLTALAAIPALTARL
jgi:hypothetical protein